MSRFNILKQLINTKIIGRTHFYNFLDGTRWDLTVSQFAEPILFEDNLSFRDTAMRGIMQEEY